MKVCFPVQKNEGVESRVYGHFGSAHMFVVVDTEINDVLVITNNDRNHTHGACDPIRALGDQKVDAVVVGGIGGGALQRLTDSGIRVYHAQAPNIKENIAMLKNLSLPEYTPERVCGGHTHRGGCAHSNPRFGGRT
jgi:predicted Fe-Mo cluster-binding NifX family protein